MRRYVFVTLSVFCVLPAVALSATQDNIAEPPWSAPLLDELCRSYAEGWYDTAGGDNLAGCLDQIAAELGKRLTASGSSGVPAADLAALALLVSHSGGDGGIVAPAVRDGAQAVSLNANTDGSGGDSEQISDLGKGQEGFAQGVERLATLPLSERMVVTGDVTSGFQAATVSDRPELTSAFGRARVNFVMRAAPGTPDGRVSQGYFFVQMIAAGGAVDSSPVGGPSSLSPINDVATDRSAFNQGVSRGNVYLKKAFYQQELGLGGQGRVLGRVGVISLSDLFDTSEFANNEARQFLNGAFVNSPGYKAGVGAPGFMLEYRRPVDLPWIDELTVRTGYGITRTFRAFTSPLWTNEIQARVLMDGRPGAYRVGVTVGNVPDAGGLNGLHLGFDQWVSDDVGIFGRYARSNRGPGSLALSPVHQSYSLGTQWRLGDDIERVSAWGVGFSQAFPIASTELTSSERILETYYRRQFTANFSATPDLQLVFGSGGQAERATHVVGSLRINVGF